MNAVNSSDPIPNRCQHRTRTGRRCRSTASAGSLLCAHHLAALSTDDVDFSADLIREDDHFQSAQQINDSLIALYKLLAAGRISPRRGSVLAYVAHLILTTHKAIDYDNSWHKRRLSSLPQRPGEPRYSQPTGPGTEPLPDTAEEFVAAALERKPS